MKFGLGTWRFFLAFLVVISHLYQHMIHGPAAYAVWGFFVLSGYFITLVLTTKYGSGLDGLGRYTFNRLLRIYPLYAVSVILGLVTLAVLHAHGVEPSKLNPQFRYPANWVEWIANIGMIFFLPQSGLAVPVAAPLFVEVAAYALMPLFARSKSAAILAVIIAFAANCQYGFAMASFLPRYVGFATCLFPFAVGSLCCHYRQELSRLSAPILSVLVWCAFGLYWLVDVYWPWTYGLPISVVLSAWVVISLARIKGGALDVLAGEMSYPIYLTHTAAGAWFILRYGYTRPFHFFVAGFVTTLAVSWVALVLVDRPLRGLKLGNRQEPPRTAEPVPGRAG
jgi:peptidoglycan/LPS O-acetylase OafA/YrhL